MEHEYCIHCWEWAIRDFSLVIFSICSLCICVYTENFLCFYFDMSMKVMAPNRINSISTKAHIQIRKNSMPIFFDCQMTHFICATLFCFLHTTRKYARYLNLLLWEVTRSNGCHRYTSAQNWFAISIVSNIMQKRCSSSLTFSFWIKS